MGKIQMLKNKSTILAVSIAMLIFCIAFASCAKFVKIKKQTEYHDKVSGVEQYILAELGDYIVFGEPIIDEDSRQIDWFIVFTTSYMTDETTLKEHPIVETMDNTRVLLNRYLTDNPECYLNDYFLRISFQIAPDKSPRSQIHYYTVGEIMNYTDQTPDEFSNIMCSIDYYDELDVESVSYISGDNVYEIDLNHGIIKSVEEVLCILDDMPNIQYVYVDESFVSELESERPDVIFFGK